MKKCLLWLLICALFMPAASAAPYYSETELDALVGKKAWIYSEEGFAPVHGMNIDYERPWGLYLNGTPVTILSGGNADGYYGGHAMVQLGEVMDGGAIFYVPIMYLKFEEVPATQATVFKGDPLYGDVDWQSKRLTPFAPDTKVTVYGQHDTWCHIQIGDEMGFTFFEDLAMDEETARMLRVNQPKAYRPATQKELGAEMDFYGMVRQLIRERGDYGNLTLEDRAALSQKELAIGDAYLYTIHLLPDENDLPEEEAIKLAQKALMDVCEVDESFLKHLKTSVQFYENPSQDPGVKKWYVYFTAYGGAYGYFYACVNSVTGEILETSEKEDMIYETRAWEEELVSPEEQARMDEESAMWSEYFKLYEAFVNEHGEDGYWSIEERAQWAQMSPVPMDDTLPGEGDITQQKALETALELVQSQYKVPEGEFDDYFVRYAFIDDGEKRFWDVFIYPVNPPDFSRNLYYGVRLDSKTGELMEEIVLPGTTNG